MPTITRIGVFLNGSPADQTVLAHAAHLSRTIRDEKIHCYHFREKGLADLRPDPTEEEFREQVQTAWPAFTEETTTCKVIPEHGVRAILHCIRDDELDVVLVGRRLPTDQMAIGPTFTKLARKAPCHVLVVTEYSYPHFERFLIPVDFSEHSKIAIALACHLIRKGKPDRPQLVLQHNVEVGYGHRYAGVTMEEYAHSLQEHALKRMDEFIADLDLEFIRVEKVVTCSTRPEEAVVALAVARKMDVVCMGSHGTESLFGALLGDTAERILEDCPLPVLIAKKREVAGQLLDLILKEEV